MNPLKSFAVILALCVVAIALPIDPHISALLVIGLVCGSVAVKLGKKEVTVVGIALVIALGYALHG